MHKSISLIKSGAEQLKALCRIEDFYKRVSKEWRGTVFVGKRSLLVVQPSNFLTAYLKA
jgi:hypothetical protein